MTGYIAEGDFRENGLKWYTRGLELDSVEAPPDEVTAAITAMSRRVDQMTRDRFAPITGSAISVAVDNVTDTLTATAHGLADDWIVQVAGTALPGGLTAATDYYVVSATANTFKLSATLGGSAVAISTNGTAVTVTAQTTQITMDGAGTPMLYLPVRVRRILGVETQDAANAWTAATSTTYRVTSTVSGATEDDVLVKGYDSVRIPIGQVLDVGSITWPYDVQTVRLTGEFGWPVTPERIKRLVALLVWDHFREASPDRRLASRLTTDDASYDMPPGEAIDVKEARTILKDYTRLKAAMV